MLTYWSVRLTKLKPLLCSGLAALWLAACLPSQPTPRIDDIEEFVPPVRPVAQAEAVIRLEPAIVFKA